MRSRSHLLLEALSKIERMTDIGINDIRLRGRCLKVQTVSFYQLICARSWIWRAATNAGVVELPMPVRPCAGKAHHECRPPACRLSQQGAGLINSEPNQQTD